MRIGQVTLGAGATQISAQNIRFAQLIIQNNTTGDNVRVGDNTVSATRGILLTPGGFFDSKLSVARGQLSQYYLYGTMGDVIDYLYENI